jgi:hypothetical protein
MFVTGCVPESSATKAQQEFSPEGQSFLDRKREPEFRDGRFGT